MVITRKSIQIEYKGNLLEGEFSYSAKGLDVRLKTPRGDLQKGEHIPYLAPKQWTDNQAEIRAKERITELWDFYCSVLLHKEEIISALALIEEKRVFLEKERNSEKLEIQRLKSLLKAGSITNVEYQKSFTPHKERCWIIDIELAKLFENAVLDILKDDFVYLDNLEYVIRTIVNK